MKLFITCFITVIAVFLQKAECSNWSYEGSNGPEHWYKHYPWCDKQKQSPINIQTALLLSQSSPHIIFSYNLPHDGETFLLKNNGHALQVDTGKTKHDFRITLQELDAHFLLEQFHFHWGKTNGVGSEHTVDGKAFSAELHLVHYNAKYATIQEAMSQPDGLAVVAFLIEIGNSNQVIESVLREVETVKEAGNSAKIQAFSLACLVKKFRKRPFYRYRGSLTTPPCYETVIWSISSQSITMSGDQLERFRSLQDSHGEELGNNFRPTQALNGREVHISR